MEATKYYAVRTGDGPFDTMYVPEPQLEEVKQWLTNYYNYVGEEVNIIVEEFTTR